MVSICKNCGQILPINNNNTIQVNQCNHNDNNSFNYNNNRRGNSPNNNSWWCLSSLCGKKLANDYIASDLSFVHEFNNDGRYARRKTIHFELDGVSTATRRATKNNTYPILKQTVSIASIGGLGPLTRFLTRSWDARRTVSNRPQIGRFQTDPKASCLETALQ